MRKSINSLVTGVLATALLAFGVALANPAAAVDIKTGYGKIDGVGLDFGTTFLAPTYDATGNATFTWKLVTGVTKLNVTGTLGAVGRSGVAVRLEMRYYDGLSATGNLVSTHHTTGFTPATDVLTSAGINWTPGGAIGVQSAKVSVASDADGDGIYVVERSIISTL
jgi:hypothetical protein